MIHHRNAFVTKSMTPQWDAKPLDYQHWLEQSCVTLKTLALGIGADNNAVIPVVTR